MNKVKPQDISRTSVLIEKFLGQNNRNKEYELEIGELSSSSNVDITLKNRIASRVGQTLITSGKFHSIFSCGNYGYGVKDGYLVYIDGALTCTNLKYIGNNYCSMVEYSSKVFYTNAQIIEYIEGKTVYALPTPIGYYRDKPPAGQLLAILGNRLYVATGPYIIFSDVGKFHSIDMRQSVRRMYSRVTMMLPVGDGMFISDTARTYFASGINPYKQPLREVFNYPAIEGQQCEIDNRMIGEGVKGKVVSWMSKQGLCYGFNGGEVINVTEQKYEVPGGVRACSYYKNTGDLSQVVSVMY